MPLNIVNNPPDSQDSNQADDFVSQPLEVSTPVFLDAVQAGKLNEVKEYAERQPELLGSRDAAGCSPLLLAIYQEQEEVAAWLLERPAMEVSFCETAALGDTERLTELLGQGGLPSQTTPDGATALQLAAFYGHPETVQLLLEAGVDVAQVSDNLLRTTALHQGATQRSEETALSICRLLLDAGAPVNAQQAGGFTALHQAASRGRRDLVQLLLERSADPQLDSDSGHTAGDLARRRQHHLPELE